MHVKTLEGRITPKKQKMFQIAKTVGSRDSLTRCVRFVVGMAIEL